MTKSTKALDTICVIGFGLLALTVVGVSAPSNAAPSDTHRSETQMTHESVDVTAIDRPNRTATLVNAEGETKTVKVPSDVKSFDALKVGDHVDIDYYESIALKLLPKGTKPSMSQTTASSPMGQGGGGVAAGARETTVSAEIISVDPRTNKITFKGPRGNTQTVSVSDPEMQKKLPTLKLGQVVQLTYTEAVAASIRRPEATPMKPK
jgi:hypothetical protein